MGSSMMRGQRPAVIVRLRQVGDSAAELLQPLVVLVEPVLSSTSYSAIEGPLPRRFRGGGRVAAMLTKTLRLPPMSPLGRCTGVTRGRTGPLEGFPAVRLGRNAAVASFSDGRSPPIRALVGLDHSWHRREGLLPRRSRGLMLQTLDHNHQRLDLCGEGGKPVFLRLLRWQYRDVGWGSRGTNHWRINPLTLPPSIAGGDLFLESSEEEKLSLTGSKLFSLNTPSWCANLLTPSQLPCTPGKRRSTSPDSCKKSPRKPDAPVGTLRRSSQSLGNRQELASIGKLETQGSDLFLVVSVSFYICSKISLSPASRRFTISRYGYPITDKKTRLIVMGCEHVRGVLPHSPPANTVSSVSGGYGCTRLAPL